MRLIELLNQGGKITIKETGEVVAAVSLGAPRATTCSIDSLRAMDSMNVTSDMETGANAFVVGERFRENIFSIYGSLPVQFYRVEGELKKRYL